jgi:hypothetical protein
VKLKRIQYTIPRQAPTNRLRNLTSIRLRIVLIPTVGTDISAGKSTWPLSRLASCANTSAAFTVLAEARFGRFLVRRLAFARLFLFANQRLLEKQEYRALHGMSVHRGTYLIRLMRVSAVM